MKKTHLTYLSVLVIAFCFISCKRNKSSEKFPPILETRSLNLKYAKGFSIKDEGNIKILSIINPWPDAGKTYTYALIDREMAPKITFMRDAYAFHL